MPDTADSGTVMRVRRTAKVLLTPGWVAFTVFAFAAAGAMIWLGHWQLDVSNSKHFDLQNFGYALQWWAFSAFAILLWARMIRDAVRKRRPEDVSSGGQLVLRHGDVAQMGPVARSGPALLVAPGERDGEPPVVYQGYVMPQSATSPGRGDAMHGAYNDYLWQLALADSAGTTGDGTSPAAAKRSKRAASADAPSPTKSLGGG